MACALWIPEINIGDPEKMEPITRVKHIPVNISLVYTFDSKEEHLCYRIQIFCEFGRGTKLPATTRMLVQNSITAMGDETRIGLGVAYSVM